MTFGNLNGDLQMLPNTTVNSDARVALIGLETARRLLDRRRLLKVAIHEASLLAGFVPRGNALAPKGNLQAVPGSQ